MRDAKFLRHFRFILRIRFSPSVLSLCIYIFLRPVISFVFNYCIAHHLLWCILLGTINVQCYYCLLFYLLTLHTLFFSSSNNFLYCTVSGELFLLHCFSIFLIVDLNFVSSILTEHFNILGELVKPFRNVMFYGKTFD